VTTPTQDTHQHEQADKLFEWLKRNRRVLITTAISIVAIAAAVWFVFAARQRREVVANRELADARAVAASGNLALAAADLSQVVERFAGTTAGQEAAVLLAQIRLMEGQPGAAVVELERLLEAGPSDQFLASAYGLLGAAHEQGGNLSAAANAYRSAADAAWYDFLKAQHLLDAARVLSVAGDTAAAVSTLERIISELAETDQTVEAQVRLYELRPNT